MAFLVTGVGSWLANNFKVLAGALAAVVVYLVANAAALGLTQPEVIGLGAITVILAVTDPNLAHTTITTTTTTTPTPTTSVPTV